MQVEQLIKGLAKADSLEIAYFRNQMEGLSPAQKEEVFIRYQHDRVNPNLVLAFALVGIFFAFSGIHRLILGQIGMGILYFFTGGLCLIGNIMDAANYRELAWTGNKARLDYRIAAVKAGRPR